MSNLEDYKVNEMYLSQFKGITVNKIKRRTNSIINS